MEKSMQKNDVHPLRSELRAHKLSTILVLAFIVLAAYLNVGSRGAIQGDPTDTPVLYIFAIIIVVVSGIIVSRQAFVDTYDVAARDAQHAVPVSARTRFFAKLWSVVLRHIVPVVLTNAAFIAFCAAFKGDTVDIEYSCIQAATILSFGLAADSLTVLTMACTGTIIGEVIAGFAFVFVAFNLLADAAVMNFVDQLFGFDGFGEYMISAYWCVVTVLVFCAAGAVYTLRDGRHTGKYVAGPAAWEMLAAGAVLLMEMRFGYPGRSWPAMLILLVIFLALHFAVFRKNARRELPRAIVIYAAVTLIYIVYVLLMYANQRGNFFSKDRSAVEAGEYWIADDEWNNNSWRSGRKYANEPDCELMIGSHILKWIDSKSSDEYHITNKDGSLPDEEQYKKLVEVLREYCSKNEYPKDTFWDVLGYVFCGADSNYEGNNFGFQLTASFGEGRDAHRERCTGYIVDEDRVPDFLKMIEEAGFVVQQVTNYRR